MKKFILAFSFAILSLSAMAQSKVGTIDAEYIITQMPEMAGVKEGMQAYDQELQESLKSDISTYEGLVKEYQANNATLTDEEKQAKESEIISLENNIKGFRQKAGVMMQMKRNELTKPLYEKINTAMVEVVNEENFTQIFHAGGTSLAFSSEEYDITLKVLKKLGIEVKE